MLYENNLRRNCKILKLSIYTLYNESSLFNCAPHDIDNLNLMRRGQGLLQVILSIA